MLAANPLAASADALTTLEATRHARMNIFWQITLVEFLLNLAVFATAVIVYGPVRALASRLRPGSVITQKAAVGILSGGATALAFLLPVHMSGGASSGSQTVLLSLAGLLDGPAAAFPAAFIALGAGLLPLLHGGSIDHLSIANALAASGVGLAIRLLLDRRKTVPSGAVSYYHLPLVGTLAAVLGLALLWWFRGWAPVPNSAIPIFASGILATSILGTLLLHETRRHKAESDLRESEAHLARQANALQFANTLLTTEMETSPDGILVVDQDTKVISTNRRFATMMKISQDDLDANNDEPMLAAVTRTMKDPEAFSERIRYLYAHPDESAHDELETNDERFIEHHTETLRTAAGQQLGRVWFFRDITDRKLAEEAVRASEERLRAVFGSVNDGIFVIDVKTGQFIDVNRSGYTMYGYTRDELIGLDIGAISSGVHPYTLAGARDLVARLGVGEQKTLEWQSKAKDGRLFWTEISARHTVFGKQEVVLAAVRDISERKRAEAQIQHMANFDVLTGLANRRVFMTSVRAAIARAERGDRGFAVLYLDLDHFKDVNDTLGHPVGDELLCAVAERIRLEARETDTVARFGGDEFAVIAATIDEPADATSLAERLILAIDKPFPIQGNEIHCGVSIGIAVYEPGLPDEELLLSHADVALYREKGEGRGGYRLFTDEMDMDVRTRVTMITELREAIISEQFFLQYQPQIDIDTERIVGVEALVRWDHPVRGIIAPDEFIHVAERAGIIVALERWIMFEACRQCKVWLDAGVAPPVVSVNVSGVQFKRALDLEGDVADVLERSGLPAERLELELTETVLMEASREHNDVVLRLRQNGIKFAIDDFGTGYSSLDYLRRFPVARIKIAQDFVRQISIEPGSAAIVRATISLGHELSMVTIAEGVETRMQLDLLKTWGCQQVQGFFYGRPLSPGDLLPHLLRGKIVKPKATAAQSAA